VVFDNDEALKREGVHPTYRKVKGFEPLQLSWGGRSWMCCFDPAPGTATTETMLF
jgi:hypothetical protein